MKLLKYINIPVFLISLAIGFLYIYMFEDKRVIYVYPKPDNVDTIQYKDASNTCFNVKQEKIECSNDMAGLFSIPVQQN
jgi:hypothetical protein